MIGGIIGVVAFAVAFRWIAGANAVSNIKEGTHDFADGFSIGYRKDAAKYREEQYKK